MCLITAAAPCAAALTLVPASPDGDAGEYSFTIEGSASEVRVWGRRVAAESHQVYIEHLYEEDESNRERTYNKTRDEEMNELTSGDYIFLKDEEGVVYEPDNAHVVFYHRSPRGQLIRYDFPRDARGKLWLSVKLAGGEFEDLYLGLADEEYLRVGTVTAEGGLDLLLNSWTGAPVAATIEAGDEFYITAFRDRCYGADSREDYVLLYEVIWEGREGWVAFGPYGGSETYFEIGSFRGR